MQRHGDTARSSLTGDEEVGDKRKIRSGITATAARSLVPLNVRSGFTCAEGSAH